MDIKSRTFWLPKDGNTTDEYEDAFAPLHDTNGDFEHFRCAVADGATEASFAKLWAELLVQGYVQQQDIEESRRQWHAALPIEQVPWFVEEKLASGAFATLAGLSLFNDGRWDATAAGDSCIFQISEMKIAAAFPLSQSDQFDNTPFLLSSNATESARAQLKTRQGTWSPGDTFFLLTDAAARWLLKREEDCSNGLEILLSLQNQDQFLSFVKLERLAQGDDGRPRLRNDDLTVMAVCL